MSMSLWKKNCLVCLAALAAIMLLPGLMFLGFLGRACLGSTKINVQDGDKCWNVPPAAKHIYAKGSYFSFTGRFEISEDDMRAYAQKRGWKIAEIQKPLDIERFWWSRREFAPGKNIEAGFTCDMRRESDGSGLFIVYDKDSGKGYIAYSHN